MKKHLLLTTLMGLSLSTTQCIEGVQEQLNGYAVEAAKFLKAKPALGCAAIAVAAVCTEPFVTNTIRGLQRAWSGQRVGEIVTRQRVGLQLLQEQDDREQTARAAVLIRNGQFNSLLDRFFNYIRPSDLTKRRLYTALFTAAGCYLLLENPSVASA